MNNAHPDNPPICDYEGSDYRTRFWENENRDYEDLAERIAMRRLLPAQAPDTERGQRLLEIASGLLLRFVLELFNQFKGQRCVCTIVPLA